jgi:uncharacterized protein
LLLLDPCSTLESDPPGHWNGVTVTDDEPMTELTTEQCWEMLHEEEFGRLAFRLIDDVHITPINYAVDGRSLLFRTAEGDKLLAVVMSSPVAFEIDRYDEETARSVIVRGTARLLGEDEEHRVENVPLRPWVTTRKYNVVEIMPTVVSGRRFVLSRPWLHIRTPGSGESAERQAR